MAAIALAGPLTNFLLAGLAATVLKVGEFSGNIKVVLTTFVAVNIGLFLFNLIPFPPLDGSRVLYYFIPESARRVFDQIESYGIMTIIGFMFFVFPLIRPFLISLNQAVMTICCDTYQNPFLESIIVLPKNQSY